ncbi:MAG TPA: phosphatase, partial [Methanobacterium sp.]|nr:phosphatase [Methanobacterium sp.]
MLHAVTDIGSNTVKMNVYRVDDHQVEVIFSKKATLGLISYVKRKELSTEGIEKLVTTLEDLKNVLDLLNIKNSHFFSTASLRNIKNSAEVQEIIQKQVDIEVDVLSGEEEGEMSFYG